MTMRKAIVGFLMLGCMFLFIETAIEHREVFGDKPISLMPVVVSLLGLIASAWAFTQWQQLSIRALQVVSVLSLIVGLGGLFFHNAERLGFGGREAMHEEEKLSATHEEEHEERHAPPLAPLALSGMGFLELIATYRRWRKEEMN
ncbi:MAG: hypothetical protein ACUVTP_09930 [Candidatus Fervidibacter sp.]|uniref:hypothetical protein n=1 Tax=Candidatus Fervidibacter sp. TaxID=3100871 RepID=UPI004049C0BC